MTRQRGKNGRFLTKAEQQQEADATRAWDNAIRHTQNNAISIARQVLANRAHEPAERHAAALAILTRASRRVANLQAGRDKR